MAELAVPRLIGLVLRLDPSGLFQKSYPGCDGVTLGESYNNSETKAKVSGNGKAIQRRSLDPYS